MSLQAQPQQPVQQQVYPATATNQPSPPSHHSNGSFGAVFIVLAIILVISTVACFLGRLCNRRRNNNNNNNRNHDRDHDHRHDHYHHNQRQRPVKQQQQQIHNIHPREGDIEFGGVDNKRIPPTIPRPKGLLVHAPARIGSHPPPPTNGRNMKDFEEIIKPDHEGELRAAV